LFIVTHGRVQARRLALCRSKFKSGASSPCGESAQCITVQIFRDGASECHVRPPIEYDDSMPKASKPAAIQPIERQRIDIFLDRIWAENGLSKNTLAAYRRDMEGLALARSARHAPECVHARASAGLHP